MLEGEPRPELGNECARHRGACRIDEPHRLAKRSILNGAVKVIAIIGAVEEVEPLVFNSFLSLLCPIGESSLQLGLLRSLTTLGPMLRTSLRAARVCMSLVHACGHVHQVGWSK